MPNVQPRDAGVPDPPPPRRHSSSGSIAGRVGALAFGARSGPSSRPPALTGGPDVGLLLRALSRRWLLALGLGVTIAGLAGAGAWVLLAPAHIAFSQIRVAAQRSSPIGPDRADSRQEFNTYLKSQAGSIKSRFVLNAALNAPEVKRLNLEHKHADPVLWLEEELKVEFQADNEWVKISLGADDPEDARVLVNAITEAYKKEVVEKEETARSEAVRLTNEIYRTENNKLRAKMGDLKKLTQKEPTVDSSEASKFQLGNLQATLTFARSRHGDVETRLAQAKGQLATLKAQGKKLDAVPIPDASIEEAVEADPSIQKDRERLRMLRDVMSEFEAISGNPSREWRYVTARRRVREAEERIAARRAERRKELLSAARQKMKAEHEARLIQVQSEIGPLLDQEKALRTEVDDLARKVQELSGTTAEYDYLKAVIERESKGVDRVADRLQTAQYDLHAKPRVTVAQEAALMARDIKKQLLGSVLGSGASFFAACFGVAWWEFRRRRVRSTDEVATGLGIRVVGAVPASADVDQLINAPPEAVLDGHVVLESVDAIRTQLLHDAAVQATRVLMVTSADPGEGKTTLASHLAGSLSRAGRRTLLVDGDLRRPALHQLFEVQEQPGLSEVLLGEVDTVDSMLTTNQEGLMVMPAGLWDREVIQALARGGVVGILEKLKEEFDFIVVDSHPVLAATDSLLLGQSADAVILSVLRDVSQTPRVYAAAQRLQSVGIRVLGAVVNGTDPEETYVPTHGYSTAAA
jgi:succinoglycan biosynthesis transport protein ExoP